MPVFTHKIVGAGGDSAIYKLVIIGVSDDEILLKVPGNEPQVGQVQNGIKYRYCKFGIGMLGDNFLVFSKNLGRHTKVDLSLPERLPYQVGFGTGRKTRQQNIGIEDNVHNSDGRSISLFVRRAHVGLQHFFHRFVIPTLFVPDFICQRCYAPELEIQ
jgi:hypothetical protein